MTAIAIVGMGCRFGDAPDLQSFWTMTLERRHAFRETPPDRWDHQAFFDTSRRATDRSYAPHGAWIDDVRSFPALALGIPPRRVEVMDPQQRLSIEIALQAIADAGRTAAELPDRTGVFIGVTATEYKSLMSTRVAAQLMGSGALGHAPEDAEVLARAVENVVPSRPFTAPGSLANMIAAAVAQELDLHGPAYSVDAACASAMVALYDAVAQLRSGQLDAALAGGVYVCVTPDHHIAFSRIGAMSAQGLCLPFDSRADGFVQGDGCGVVLLKRLEDAERDGDRIYAVLDGIAMNNDGRGDGPMAPVLGGQVKVIQQAWADAGVDPADLGYIEAHGTGTQVGDITEFTGLMQSLGDKAQRVAIGSSKANVGHTMSAAGVAGVIRSALAIYHKTLPPMAGFESPKDDLGLDGSPFHVPTAPQAWEGKRVAGISSFGFGGTNGHAVLSGVDVEVTPDTQAELVRISAPDIETLRSLAAQTADAVERDATITVAALARAWAKRREQASRLGIVAASRDELIEGLRAFASGEHASGVVHGETDGETPSLCFLYPGQGAQRVNMLADTVARFPVVAETLNELESELSGDLSTPLTHLLYPERRDQAVDEDTASAELTDTANCQPALLSCGIALTRLLETVGITPDVVVGHSLGEFTAAAAGGVVSAADAARFVAARGRAMAELDGDHGAMAAVMADEETVDGLLVDGAVLANHNHPRQAVVSGTTEAIDKVVARAKEAGVKAKKLQVSHGFHSPVLADLDVTPLVDALELSDPERTVASGIADHPYADAAEARSVFIQHGTSPVRFVRALEQCRSAGADLYLQVGAGGPLAAFARGGLPRDHRGILTLAGKRDDDGGTTVLETLAQLWVRGVEMDLDGITAEAQVASAPPERLPREVYWAVKDEAQRSLQIREGSGASYVQAEPTRQPAPVSAASEGDEVTDQVLAVVAKVSAYPRDALRTKMSLVEDLGFDSLMVGDLATGLAESFPGLGGIPQELLLNRPTVQDLVDFVQGGGQSVQEADDDAPLLAYVPRWVGAPLPTHHRGSTGQVGVIGPNAKALATALKGHVDIVPHAQAGTLLWAADMGDPVPVAAVLAGEAGLPDPAGDLIGALDDHARAGRSPSVVVVHRDDDPWAEGLAAVARGISREFPGARGQRIAVPAGFSDWKRLADELASADRSSDVHLGDTRQVRGFRQVEQAGDGLPDGAVLITGGTRGIGLKLATALHEDGHTVLLVGRSDPDEDAQALLNGDRARHIQADVLDLEALTNGIGDTDVGTVIHCAGVLADGPLGEVDPQRGALARNVKTAGFVNAIRAASPALALGLGSWAGRFGSRHQAHYAAGNGQLAGLAAFAPDGIRIVVDEFGPWSSSEMAQTIPAPVKQAMRAEGVDFVGDEAGMDAVLADLRGGHGIVVRGRALPAVERQVRVVRTLSVGTDPFLADHAIEGVPVLPLAAAADLVADAACVAPPFEIRDLTLFSGITVEDPTNIEITVRGDRAEIRAGDKKVLSYRAIVRPLEDAPELPSAPQGGEPSTLSVQDFYSDVTFHGPLFQGIERIDGIGDDFVRGQVRTARPSDFTPGSQRAGFSVDPLALDSVMQLSAVVAWIRYQRAGTPVGIGRYVQLKPWPEGPLTAEVHLGEPSEEGDRFEGTLVLRDRSGEAVALSEDTVAELRKVETDDDAVEIKPEWVDASAFPGLKDLKNRLEAAEMMGIRNPYFTVHEGTAKNTTSVDGEELVNFSSYNYIGLSGDERVLAQVRDAVDQYGTSVSASRVASGERPFHGELEALLATCQGCDDALVFTAGHATNVTTIGHLMGPDDLILHDELIHDSALQGIKLSGAARRGFAHDDPRDLERQLKELRRHYQKVLIIIEGVYSMDGDICDLPEYIRLKKKHGCLLMVDEAHSFGIVGETGCGVAEHYGIPGSEVDIWMGTLSKSLASCGGWIAGSEDLITYLRYTAPGFVYSAGITAANGVAALASLRLMLEEPERVKTLQSNAQFFYDECEKRGLDTGPADGESGVIPVVTGNSMHALMLSQRLLDQGINVQPIVYPAVADEASRLRFFLSSTHTEEQLRWTAECVAETLAGVRKEFAIPGAAR